MDSGALVLLLALCLAAATWGQSAGDFSAKYPAVNGHEVRPGILMTARYGIDGQACELVLEKRHMTKTGVDLGAAFSQEEVMKLFEELVPEAERGKRLRGFLGPGRWHS